MTADHSHHSTNLNYDMMICVTHFSGDGMSIHQLANDFFVLLGSCMDKTALLEKLTAEWSEKYTNVFERVISVILMWFQKEIMCTIDSSRRCHLQ